MKDLVMTSIDRFGWDEVKVWATSLRKTGYTGDIVAIVYRHSDARLVTESQKLDITLMEATVGWDGRPIDHSEQPRHPSMVCRNRFFHMWWYLQDKKDMYRWIISTDVRDVIFQRNPSIHLDSLEIESHIKILASSEGQIYKEEPWNAEDQSNAFGPVVWSLTMSNHKVVNAGVMTVRGSDAADIYLNIYFTSKHHPDAAADQAAYNLLTETSLKDVTMVLKHDTAWACQCGTVLDPSKPFHKQTFKEELPKFTNDGLFVTTNGTPFTIVHQYDRIPGVKEIIERKYL